ncbi:hypothetical protein EDC94DRAFT_588670 [Helicostylum pulchrum]|nr:hypothetical protein EDC94DRAFT_588670 [Helicostylum pulchrum]
MFSPCYYIAVLPACLLRDVLSNDVVAIAVNKDRPGNIRRFVYYQLVTFPLSLFPLHNLLLNKLQLRKAVTIENQSLLKLLVIEEIASRFETNSKDVRVWLEKCKIFKLK